MEGDSFEVDNEVLVKVVEYYVWVGDFVEVCIMEVMDYDLFGEVVG